MRKLVFPLFFLLFLVTEVYATKVEYFGPSWYETCDIGVCTRTLYSGTVHMQDEWGNYKPYVNVTKVIWENGKLKIKWRDAEHLDKEIDVETALFSQGEKFEPIDFPNMNYTMDIEEKNFNYKFNISFNLPRDDLVIALDIATDFDYSLKEKSVVIGQHEVGFSDAVENNYSVSIGTYLGPKGKKIIRINISQDWIGNGTFINDSVIIDPTVTLQTANSENLDDVYVELNDYNDGHTSYGYNTATIEIWRQIDLTVRYGYIKFNLSSIPDKVNVTESKLYLYCYNALTDSSRLNVSHVYNHTWTEESIKWNNQPCGESGENDHISPNDTSQCNLTPEDQKVVGDCTNSWVSWGVTNAVRNETDDGDQNVSFIIHHRRQDSWTNWKDFRSKEYTTDIALRPYLTITYLINTTVGAVNTLNTSLLSETIFRWDKAENVTIRADVNHTYGADKLNVTLIEIKNPAGTEKVNNATMKNISSITNGYVYEYNYTLPYESASEGTWTVKVYANDTTNFWDSNSTTFTVGQIKKLVPSAIQGDANEGSNVGWTMKSVVINNTMSKRFTNETENITTLSTCAYNNTIVLLHPNGTSYPYYSNTSDGFMNWTIAEINASQVQRWNITYYTPAPTEDKINEWISGGYWYYSFNTTGSCVSYSDVDYTVAVASNASELKLYDNTTGTPSRVDTNPDWNWLASGGVATFTVPTLSNKTLYVSGLVTVSGSVTDTISTAQVTSNPSPFQIIEWRETHHICNPNTFEVEWDDHKIYVPDDAIVIRWGDVERREIFHDIYGDYFLVNEIFEGDSCKDDYLSFTTEGVTSSETYDLPDYITVGEIPKVYIDVDISNPTKYDVDGVKLSIQVRYGKDVKLYDRNIVVWENAPEEEFKYYKVMDYSIPGAEARIYNIVYTISKITAGQTAKYLVYFKMPTVEALKVTSVPEIIEGKQGMKQILYYRNNAPVKYDSVKYFTTVDGLKSVIKCVDSDGKFLECSSWGDSIAVEMGSLDGQEQGTVTIFYETRPVGFGERIWDPIVRKWEDFKKAIGDLVNSLIYSILSFFRVV